MLRTSQLAPKGDASAVLEMGDACVVNMVGYMADDAGNKGEALPNAASGDQVDVVMETGKYMEGLVEGLVGAKIDDVREVKVTFPPFLKDKTLAGKTAIFDVTVLSVDTRILPELDDEFANAIRPGLTADGLMEEVKTAGEVAGRRAGAKRQLELYLTFVPLASLTPFHSSLRPSLQSTLRTLRSSPSPATQPSRGPSPKRLRW